MEIFVKTWKCQLTEDVLSAHCSITGVHCGRSLSLSSPSSGVIGMLYDMKCCLNVDSFQ